VPTSVLSHLAYEYDQVGNRKRKLDSAQLLDVIYTYDTDIPLGQPSPYDSRNNRLMSYQTFDAAGLDSTTYYYYNDCGNVTRVVTDEEATDNYTSTWLEYARNGRAVIYAVGESWEWQGPGFDPANYDISYAREFRYDGARQRYLNRELDPAGIQENPPDYTPVSEVWSDYAGNSIYGDFTAVGETITNVRSFQPGIARVNDPLGTPVTEYYHADMLGSTRIMTDGAGDGLGEAYYTAFGQLQFAGTAHRYGYAGAWGYQAPSSDSPSDPYLAFPFLHVGARYYDPASGRFLQRDPLGIGGGVNVYAYARLRPQALVDPTGLQARRGVGTILDDAGGGHPDAYAALACQILWARGSCACVGEPGYPPACQEELDNRGPPPANYSPPPEWLIHPIQWIRDFLTEPSPPRGDFELPTDGVRLV